MAIKKARCGPRLVLTSLSAVLTSVRRGQTSYAAWRGRLFLTIGEDKRVTIHNSWNYATGRGGGQGTGGARLTWV